MSEQPSSRPKGSRPFEPLAPDVHEPEGVRAFPQRGGGDAETNLESTFRRLVGRQATGEERERLFRLRDALGLQDNDAFWSIVMALEHYDSLFRRYPAELAAATDRALETARAACATAAQQEVALVQHALSEKVAETSAALAKKLAERPIGIHRFSLALGGIVAFGALCEHAGYAFGSGARPLWVAPERDLHGIAGIVATVSSAPAGWMVFALLLPTAGCAAKLGWSFGVDPSARLLERAVGWCILAISLLGALGCARILAQLTG